MELFEFANASLRPVFQAHKSFVTNPKIQACGLLHELPDDEKCRFVEQTESCHDSDQYIDYSHFLYCVLDNSWLALFLLKLFLLAILCLFIFIILGETADRFFCPALAALSNAMHLSENLAGVTLLAFGNGSPDLFTALADYEGDTDMMYAELIGAAAFIIGVVAASIIMLRPFQVRPADMIRDTVIFMAGVVWLGEAFRDEQFSYLECCIAVSIYLLYLILVFADDCYVKWSRKRKKISQYKLTDSLKKQLETLDKRHTFEADSSHDKSVDDLEKPSSPSIEKLEFANSILMKQFFESINPIEDWQESSKMERFCMVFKAPIVFMLLIIIPCVDYTAPINGWSKLLNVIHLFTLPLAVIVLKQFYPVTFYGLTVFAYVMPVCALLALLVFFTSRTDRPPKYHLCFAVFGSFVGSIVVISVMAKEVVAILSTLGVVSNLSNSFLGLSVLAWGNSVGDLISNIALARKGYYRMGFAASFGGPMFNTFLGIAVVCFLKNYYGTGRAFVREGPMGKTCIVMFSHMLFFTLATFAFCKFQGRRSVGVVMLVVYISLLFYSILAEFELIHPYGTDHQNEGQFNN